MIRTSRLLLRPPLPRDASVIAALMTPAISRWLSTWPTPFTPEMAEQRIERAQAANARGHALIRVIECAGQVAGWIGGGPEGSSESSPEHSRQGEFGYWLGAMHHHQALMQEAAPAWLEAARTRLGLDGIEATTHLANEGSRRVLATCGLVPIGTRQHWVSARNREETVEVWRRSWSASR